MRHCARSRSRSHPPLIRTTMTRRAPQVPRPGDTGNADSQLSTGDFNGSRPHRPIYHDKSPGVAGSAAMLAWHRLRRGRARRRWRRRLGGSNLPSIAGKNAGSNTAPVHRPARGGRPRRPQDPRPADRSLGRYLKAWPHSCPPSRHCWQLLSTVHSRVKPGAGPRSHPARAELVIPRRRGW